MSIEEESCIMSTEQEEAPREKINIYSIKIDKNLLLEFLMCEDDEINDVHLDEIKKLLVIIVYKYANAYQYMREEITAGVITTMLERRKGFNPDMDAYNYLYTMARNEVGNIVYRARKEFSTEDVISYKEEGSYDIDMLETTDTPPSVIKYAHYLTGEEDYTVKRISRSDVLDIILWLRIHESKTFRHAPDFIKKDQKTLDVMYNTLKQFIL